MSAAPRRPSGRGGATGAVSGTRSSRRLEAPPAAVAIGSGRRTGPADRRRPDARSRADAHRRGGARPGAGRRARARLGHAAGRRAGRREVDGAAPGAGRAGGGRAAGAVRLGRGVGAPGPSTRRAARCGPSRDLPRHRHHAAGSAHPRARRPAGRGGGRLHPVAARSRPDLGAGLGRAGAPLCARAGRRGEGVRPCDHRGRSRHEGGCAGRSSRARARGRHRVVVRGRARPPAAHVARHQAPVRRHRRDRPPRHDRGRAGRGARPVGDVPRRSSSRRRRLGRGRHDRGSAPGPRRGAVARRADATSPTLDARCRASTPAAWAWCSPCSNVGSSSRSHRPTRTRSRSVAPGSSSPRPTSGSRSRWCRPGRASRCPTTWWCAASSASVASYAGWATSRRRLSEAARLGFRRAVGGGLVATRRRGPRR